MKYGKSIG